jgi:hypothetical protein
MTDTTDSGKPMRGFWIISIVALLWNLMGVMTYLMSVTMSPETLAAMPEAERALYAAVPAWATSAYAIAVFAGTLGCIALLMRKAWATPVFVVSLVAVLTQMGWWMFMTPMLDVLGGTAAIMPLLVVVIALYLVWFSRSATTKGWIR